MDGELIRYMNDTISGGTLIAIVVVLISATVWVTQFLNNITEKHDKKVRETIMDEIAEDENDKTIDQLAATVSNLTAQVSELNNQIKQNKESTKENINAMSESISKISDDLDNNMSTLSERLTNLEENVDKVTDSELAAIRSFIIGQYQKWMELKYIDIYSLSVIEDRYKSYTARDGNTFIYDLMVQLRNLPTRPMIVDSDGNDPIKYFEEHPDHHPKYKNQLYQYPSVKSTNDTIISKVTNF